MYIGKRRRIESSKSGDHESQGNKKELLGINNSKTTGNFIFLNVLLIV